MFYNMKGGYNTNRRLLQEQVKEDAIEAPLPQTLAIKGPFKPTSPFDTSMALTILVLLTALFFLGFFSLYIRRFADEESRVARRRRRQQQQLPPDLPGRLQAAINYTNGHRKGLDPSSIIALPLVAYGGAAKHRMIDDCTICLCEFEEGEMVKLIPNCRHVFHPKCVDTWLASHVSCPLCRTTQLFKKKRCEVCLDVVQERDRNGVSGGDHAGELTAGDGDTWREVVNSGSRRSCSDSRLEEEVRGVVLRRSMSF